MGEGENRRRERKRRGGRGGRGQGGGGRRRGGAGGEKQDEDNDEEGEEDDEEQQQEQQQEEQEEEQQQEQDAQNGQVGDHCTSRSQSSRAGGLQPQVHSAAGQQPSVYQRQFHGRHFTSTGIDQTDLGKTSILPGLISSSDIPISNLICI